MPEVLESQWIVIAANPLPFIVVGLAVAGLTAGIVKWLMSERIETLKERIQGCQEDNARLNGEKTHLLKRLDEHGESIEDLKAELNRLPRIHVSAEVPKNVRDGDLWIEPSDKK